MAVTCPKRFTREVIWSGSGGGEVFSVEDDFRFMEPFCGYPLSFDALIHMRNIPTKRTL
jgi:hypothetical protein